MFGAVDGGYAVLVDELVRRADVRWAQVTVERVDRLRRGWELVDDEGTRWHADAVVLAVPAPRLAEARRTTSRRGPRRPRGASRWRPRRWWRWRCPGGTPLPEQSGVLVASGERLRAKAITLSSRKWGRRGNVELVRLSFGRFGDEPRAAAPAMRICWQWSAQDLATLFGVNVEPVDCRVQRWIDAMPQYGPGHGDLVAELRAGLPPTLAVAGGYLDGIGVPACVAAATEGGRRR